jgi:hypothetical protein
MPSLVLETNVKVAQRDSVQDGCQLTKRLQVTETKSFVLDFSKVQHILVSLA